MADPDAEEVSYELLQELVRAERRSNKLMPVSARFWPRVRTFLENVKQEFRAEQERDPWSRKAMLLSDETKNARHAAENLWALRERKLAMLALARERERKRPEGITADEAQVFDGLMHVLDRSRQAIFSGTPAPPLPPAAGAPTAAGSAPVAPSPTPTTPTTSPGVGSDVQPRTAAGTAQEDGAGRDDAARAANPRPAPDAPDLPTPAPTPDQPPSQAEAPGTPPVPAIVPADQEGQESVVTIRALGDIPPFVGPDMQTYLLKEGDLATVPPTIADLLVKRKKAAVVEGL